MVNRRMMLFGAFAFAALASRSVGFMSTLKSSKSLRMPPCGGPVLPGTGKTLVAAMMVAQYARLNPSKWCVFVTETCPLAQQQGDYLKAECPELKDRWVRSALVPCILQSGKARRYTDRTRNGTRCGLP